METEPGPDPTTTVPGGDHPVTSVDQPVAPAEGQVKGKRGRMRPVVGWIITIVVALLISTGTRAYAVQSYFIPTPSMTPTLMPGDRILVNKLSSTIHVG